MNNQDRDTRSLDQNARVKDLTAALEEAERKLSERDALINDAFDQTEAARSQYSQAVERSEALLRRLDNIASELKSANESIASLTEKSASLEKDLQQRDSRIAVLEQTCAESDNALEAIHGDNDRRDRRDQATRKLPQGSVVYILESLDNVGVQHRISRTTTTIGRAPANDIAVYAGSISRYHARFVVEPEGLLLIDLKSTNGCTVNGQAVLRRMLVDGDAVSIGKAMFRLSVQPLGAETEDDGAGDKTTFDDQSFTRTVLNIHKDAIPELSNRVGA